MKVIYKYQLQILDAKQSFFFNEGSKVLSFQMQLGTPVIWVEHPCNQPPVQRDFVIVPTGCIVDIDNCTYIGTAQDGGLVWHLYEAHE